MGILFVYGKFLQRPAAADTNPMMEGVFTMNKRPTNGVHCTVERCIYHDGGNGCNAAQIEVNCCGSPKTTMCSTFCAE